MTTSCERYLFHFTAKDTTPKNELSTSYLSTCISTTEVSRLAESLRSGRLSNIRLYLSLRHATEHITKLTTELAEMKKEKAFADQYMFSLEQRNGSLSRELEKVYQELSRMRNLIASSLRAVRKLRAGFDTAATSRTGETIPEVTNPSYSTSV
jgi:chromosome segregation ATPase